MLKVGNVFRIRSEEWFKETFGEPDKDGKVKIFNIGRWSLSTCGIEFIVTHVDDSDNDGARGVVISNDIFGGYMMSDVKLFCIAEKMSDSSAMTNREWLESLSDNELAVQINAFCLSSYRGTSYWNDWLKKKHSEVSV